MNRLLFRFALLFFCLGWLSVAQTQAQNCTPTTTFTELGLYPALLPNGQVGETYNPTVVTATYLPDSTVQVPFEIQPGDTPVTVTVTRVVVEEIDGAPPGMSWAAPSCTPPFCTYNISPANYHSCLILSGTPTLPGVYNPYIKFAIEGTFIMPYDYPAADPQVFRGQLIQIENLPQVIIDSLMYKGYDPETLRRARFESQITIAPEQTLCNPDSVYTERGLHPKIVRTAQINQTYSPVSMTLDFPLTAKLPLPDATEGTVIYEFEFTDFIIESAGGLPAGMSFDIANLLSPPDTFTLDPSDFSKNRLCFELKGKPLAAGEYYPFIRFRAKGNYNRKGETVFSTIDNLYDNLPEFRPFRAFTFHTYLRVTPADLPAVCDNEPGKYPDAVGLFPSGNADTLLPRGLNKQPFNNGQPVAGVIQFPYESKLQKSFGVAPNAATIRAEMDFLTFKSDSIRRLPTGMNFSGITVGTTYKVARQEPAQYRRLCFQAEGTPNSDVTGLFEPYVAFTGSGFVKFDNFYLRMDSLPALFADFRAFRPGTFFYLDKSTGVLDALPQLSDFQLWPNPVARQLNLRYTLNQSATVACQILDLTGRPLKTSQPAILNAGTQQTDIETENLPAGLYLLQLNIDGQKAAVRFVKE